MFRNSPGIFAHEHGAMGLEAGQAGINEVALLRVEEKARRSGTESFGRIF
jgi:hypothetical protein